MIYKVRHNTLPDYANLAFDKNLHHTEINAKGLTTEILTHLMSFAAQNGKASSAWAPF